MTKKGTVYGDLFRYAPAGSVRSEVWKERMESEFDSYPEVKTLNFIRLNLSLIITKFNAY